ncbi:MAG: hypothetical protein MZV64_70140 [Ignavibacteriales bacterium]|nr:hypothetical protein [Ignavibacteriales bacterium]
MKQKMNSFSLDDFINNAIQEDIGNGDHSSLACIPSDKTGKAQLLIKQNGILAGVEVAQKVFSIIDPSLKLEIFLTDGHQIKPGDVAFIVSGKVQSILKAERLVLNIMQRMSGIATQTNEYVKKISRYKSKNFRYPKNHSWIQIF